MCCELSSTCCGGQPDRGSHALARRLRPVARGPDEVGADEDDPGLAVVEHEGRRLHRLAVAARRLGPAEEPHQVDADGRRDRNRRGSCEQRRRRHSPKATSSLTPSPETTCSFTSATPSSKMSAISVDLGRRQDQRRREGRVVRRCADEQAAPAGRTLHGGPDGLVGRERPTRVRVDEVEAVEQPAPAQRAGDRVARRRSRAAAPRARRRAGGRSRARRAPRRSGSRPGRRRPRPGCPRRCGPPGTGARRRPRPRTPADLLGEQDGRDRRVAAGEPLARRRGCPATRRPARQRTRSRAGRSR